MFEFDLLRRDASHKESRRYNMLMRAFIVPFKVGY